MTKTLHNQYRPCYVSPPGDTLLETLEAIGMPRAELAKRMGQPVQMINAIIQAKAVITDEIAWQLEQVLRIPASFWLNGERDYQEFLGCLAKERRLRRWVGWLKEIPIQDMMQQGWIPTQREKTLQVLEALKFFAVASPNGWRSAWECTVMMYRKSKALTSNFGALTAWLRQGEIQSRLIDCSPYNEEAFRQALVRIRSLDSRVRRCVARSIGASVCQCWCGRGFCVGGPQCGCEWCNTLDRVYEGVDTAWLAL